MNSYPVVSTANATEPCTVSRQPEKISGSTSRVKNTFFLDAPASLKLEMPIRGHKLFMRYSQQGIRSNRSSDNRTIG